MTKFTATAADTARATRRLRWIAPTKSTTPALECVKVKAGKDGLTFTCADVDFELQITVPGAGAGEMLLLLDPLHRAAASTTGDVAIEKVGEKAQGRVGSFNVNISSPDAKNFPVLSPGKTPTAGFVAVADTFGWATQYPEHAMSSDETRINMNGLLLHWSRLGNAKDGLATAATDGRQFVRCNLGDDAKPLGNLKPSNFEGIIPRKAVYALNKLLFDLDPDGGEKIAVKQFDGKNGRVVFAAADWKLTTKCVDASFVDYRKAIPVRKEAAPHRISVDAALLEGAVKAMKAVSGDIRIEAAEKELLVSIKTEKAEALEIVEAEVTNPITFSINAAYLMNALSNCDNRAVIELETATGPARVIDPDQDEIVMLVMPEKKIGDAPEIATPKALPKPKLDSTNISKVKPAKSGKQPQKKAA